MTANEILNNLAKSGFKLRRAGDNLQARPALPPDLAAEVLEHKDVLMEVICVSNMLVRTGLRQPGGSVEIIASDPAMPHPESRQIKPLPNVRRCLVCTGSRHWRRGIDGKPVCAICAEGGPGEIVGPRFLASLRSQ